MFLGHFVPSSVAALSTLCVTVTFILTAPGSSMRAACGEELVSHSQLKFLEQSIEHMASQKRYVEQINELI